MIIPTGMKKNGKSGKVNLRKSVKFEFYKCHCSHDCFTNVSRSDRKKCFKYYWKLEDFRAQTSFLRDSIKEASTEYIVFYTFL